MFTVNKTVVVQETYYIEGDRIIIKSYFEEEEYLLAQIASNKIMFINLKTGNRFLDEPLDINSPTIRGVTLDQINEHFDKYATTIHNVKPRCFPVDKT